MKGRLLVIEGADASGKHTQSKLLAERLEKEGHKVAFFSFPRYETFFGKLVTKYLQGEFGSLKEVKPELASLLYSLDRYDALPEIEKALKQGKAVVCDRYVASNVAHQAAKFQGGERKQFIEWVESVELRLPKPDLTIFLDLPVEVSAKLMQSRAREKDIHELNKPYLEATRQVYLKLAKQSGWITINCASQKGIRSREEIHELVWESIARPLHYYQKHKHFLPFQLSVCRRPLPQ